MNIKIHFLKNMIKLFLYKHKFKQIIILMNGI